MPPAVVTRSPHRPRGVRVHRWRLRQLSARDDAQLKNDVTCHRIGSIASAISGPVPALLLQPLMGTSCPLGDVPVSILETVMQVQFKDTPAQDDSNVVSKADPHFDLMLFGRLQQDCEYFLGFGGRAKKHLWAGDEVKQITKMKELYAALTVKPEWLTMEGIEWYEKQMVYGQDARTVSAVRTHSADSISGMDARVFLAKARVAEGIYGKDSELCSALTLDAVLEAESDGRNAYSNDQPLPGLFKDESVLIQAWHNGYDASAVMDEMAHCHGCKNAAGDPCTSHG